VPEQVNSFCRICEALCGIELTVDEGRVVDIRPDGDHVATGGFGCVKGMRQHELYGSPDRLRYPMKRIGKSWKRISWQQAIQEIGEKTRALRAVDPDSIAMYVGTAAGFGVLHPMFAQGFMDGIGSTRMFSSATQDCSNKFAVSRLMYGFPFTLTYPDILETDCLIIVGANPAVSKWSFLQVPNPVEHLKSLAQRGGRIFVVDPRRTETAQSVGEHVFIRPGTDIFFYLSFLNELDRQDGIDRDRVARYMTGLERALEVAAPWPAERTEPVTGIGSDLLQSMVEAYRSANGAAMYCSTGVNMGGSGSLAFWIQEVINAASGNLDRSGGTLVGEGVVDFPAFGKKQGLLVRDNRSRIGDFTSVNDGLPGGILADEILTPGRGQIRALFVTGGNPLLTMPNSNRLRAAMQALELLVCLDILPSETATIGHYMLPCTSPLQRPDLPFVFPLMLGLQVRPYLQATRAVLPPDGEQRDEASVYLDLARATEVRLFGSRFLQAIIRVLTMAFGVRRGFGVRDVPQELLLSLLLKVMRQPSFRALLRSPSGRLRPPNRPGTFLGRRVLTDSGLVDLAPSALVQAAGRLETVFETERSESAAYRLITRRAIMTHNSWTHNLSRFVRGARTTNYLYMHPSDAAREGLSEGDLADVTSDTAAVRVPVQLLDTLMPGVVALPHGWGHQHARGLAVASRTRGVNVNILAADGPASVERPSGMARLTGIPVRVQPASGPQEEHSWSGLPQDLMESPGGLSPGAVQS
jgi:formate dehydrogenase